MLPSLGNPLAVGVAPQRNQRQRESGSCCDPKRTCVTLGPTRISRSHGQTDMPLCWHGQEMKKRCSGVPVLANNMLECLRKEQANLSPRCVALANNVVRGCDSDAMRLCQAVVAGQGNILGCLTMARRSVFLTMQCGSRRGFSASMKTEPLGDNPKGTFAHCGSVAVSGRQGPQSGCARTLRADERSRQL
jgi:hypothetical protein